MTALAPLHEPAALRSIRLVGSLRPRTPGVACFDTAFHSTLPAVAATYALPRSWRERFGIRRYGFHGLSHVYIARRTAELAGPAGRRIVSCHLGSGASLAAISDGASVDTTMGFTPLEGLVMGTRSGSVDPGLLVWLARQGITVDELDRGLEHESGLLGLAGTGDMRTVLSNAGAGDADAQLALEVFLYRLLPRDRGDRRRRWTGSTSLRSRAASGSIRGRSARGLPRASGSSAWRSTRPPIARRSRTSR